MERLCAAEPCLSEYRISRFLGEGSFGSVLLATVVETGEEVSRPLGWVDQPGCPSLFVSWICGCPQLHTSPPLPPFCRGPRNHTLATR